MKVPLIVLGGGAKREERLPDEHRIYGPKGMTVRLGERPLIDVAVDRFRASAAFEPIFIAGPAAAYGPARGDAEVIDTDADFAGNIRTSLRAVVDRLSPEAVAFAACDVIPDPQELDALLDDYRRHAPLDFWYPLIRVPEDPALLGAAAGKRRYRLIPEGSDEPVEILPGHLAIIDPRAIRLSLIFRALELAYRSRTRPVFTRSLYMTFHVLRWLIGRDLRGLLRFRLPSMTVEVVSNAIALGHGIGTETARQKRIEARLRRLFIRRRHRRKYRRRGRIPALAGLSLAKDIDTDREAAERSAEFS